MRWSIDLVSDLIFDESLGSSRNESDAVLDAENLVTALNNKGLKYIVDLQYPRKNHVYLSLTSSLFHNLIYTVHVMGQYVTVILQFGNSSICFLHDYSPTSHSKFRVI